MVQFCLTEVSLLLLSLLALLVSSEARETKVKELRRNRREWILPPTKLMENTDYTHLTHIAKIRSDKDKDEMVQYFLSGEGADQKPLNLFVVDRITGFVRITGILDRETCPYYNLTGVARYRNGTTAESNIPLTVTVLDQNDNAPSIELHTGNITEASNKGTFIMQLKGEDKDQAGTMNAKISYKIVSQEPEGIGHMFNLDENTGKLYVKKPTLDREACDFYKLVIKVSDLGGAAGGLTGTGAVEIKILDINDNIPTLEKSEYSGSVDENVDNVVVMKIKALDKDQEHTDNWLTVFTIAKGNEDNLFSIETDNKTNEGILKLIKAVDFEEVQNLQLGLLIENVAPFVTGSAVEMDVDVQVGEGGPLATGAGVGAGAGVGLGADLGVNVGVDAGVNVDVGLDLEGGIDVGLDAGLKPEAGAAGIKPGVGAGLKPDLKPGPGTKLKPEKSPKSYPVKIAVNNVPEGPAFKPNTKNIPVSEDPKEAPQNGVIAVFAATDSDTGKQAEHVSYAKAYDPDNWFTIDEETAEIKINKVPDRESPFLINGTYIGKILAITKDMPPKTATGTIAIQVTDSNDHCPTLTTTHTSLCSDEKSVYVTGIDKDVRPNAAPFTFRIIPDGTQGRWVVEVINETSAALHSSGPLWPGPHELQVEVLDAQGLSCPTAEVFTVDVCTCVETEDCRLKTAKLGTTSSKLAAPAIGLLLMASCLLIFIPLLLLLCQCGGADRIFPDKFTELPFNTKEHLISYHTEGRGEDKEMSLQSLPVTLGTLRKVETRRSLKSKTEISKIMETDQTQIGNEQKFQGACRDVIEVDNSYTLSRESMSYGNGRATFSGNMLGIQHTTALYEDITLPDAFLSDYYSQKALCAAPAENTLLEYHFEGEGSSAGSVGCCSLLENDSDLHALTDFGPKFKTLAEICIPPSVTPKTIPPHNVVGATKSTAGFVEPVSKSRLGHIVETKHADIKTEKAMSSIIKQQSSVSTVSTAPSMTLPHAKITRMSRSSDINHSDKLPSPIQTVLIQQQPIYHSRPIPQPIQYVVQPHLQNALLLVDGSNRHNLFLIQGTENSENPASSSLPVSPTLFIPNSPAVSLGSAEAWKIM